MKGLLETRYPTVDRIRLVQDNLNTHTPGSFYTAFPPQEAFELGQKFALHYTPVKASWLNRAELEFSALSLQCLNRRMGDLEHFEREVGLWAYQRNHARKTVRWKFTTTDARRKLQSRYPIIQD